jgi:glycosyltransferase involved in cell wall biosynthesis
MGKVLSIAVAAYNVEDYLRRGLESYCDPALAAGLEVIIVNDGSSDGTRAIADEFVAAQPGVFRLVNKSNGGHGSAINAALEVAGGRYFRIIDGDDWAHTGNLVRLLELLRDCESDLVVDVKREVPISAGESRLFPLPADLPRGVAVPFADVCLRDDAESFLMIHTLNVRTDFVREQGLRLLEHTYYVDSEFIVKATCAAQSIEFCDLEVCQYLVGNVAQSVDPLNYVRHYEDHLRVCDELLRYGAAAGLSGVRGRYLEQRIVLLIHTHYNIALIFDPERKRGLERARAFKAHLERDYPHFAALTAARYRRALLLHHLGVDAPKLKRLMRR